jgi:hypothetical protein
MDGLEVVLMVYISDSFVENTTVRSIQLVQILYKFMTILIYLI